jgi:hypothetical protein
VAVHWTLTTICDSDFLHTQVQWRNKTYGTEGIRKRNQMLCTFQRVICCTGITVLLLHLYSLLADNLYIITLPHFRFIALHTMITYIHWQHWTNIHLHISCCALCNPFDTPKKLDAQVLVIEFVITTISLALWLREKEPRNHLLSSHFLISSTCAMACKCEQMISPHRFIHLELFFPHHLFRDFSSWLLTFWRFTFVSFNRDL